MTDENKATPIPPVPTPPAPKPPVIKTEQWYKLNMRDSTGKLRPELSRGVVYEMSSKWGDVIASISANRWATFEDLVQAVWEREKKQYFKHTTRTRKQIEEAIHELVQAGIILKK